LTQRILGWNLTNDNVGSLPTELQGPFFRLPCIHTFALAIFLIKQKGIDGTS
jgi:hypothetical protein